MKVVAKYNVKDDAELKKIHNQVSKLKSWLSAPLMMAPQATVISVASAYWREAILDFARVANIVVVDVSELSENVNWGI